MLRLRILCLPVLNLAIACSQPGIDTSSDEQMKTSIIAVRGSLPNDQRARFDTALQVLAFSQVDLAAVFSQPAAVTAGSLETTVKELLNGRTGAQVIAAADSIMRLREAKEREQALQEIHELEARKDSADRDRRELQKFVVIRSRFYKRPSEFGLPDPTIEMTVRNGTSHAISRAYFVGTLASPGRSVPWVKDNFNYQIRGGLEPSEQASWRLSPKMFSDWGSVKSPNDAVLTVEVVRLDGPEGQKLYSSTDFDDKDALRLAALRAKFGAH